MLAFRCYFNPSLKFGATFTLSGSDITNANGSWTICHVDYDLESNVYHGKWDAAIEAYPPGYVGIART